MAAAAAARGMSAPTRWTLRGALWWAVGWASRCRWSRQHHPRCMRMGSGKAMARSSGQVRRVQAVSRGGETGKWGAWSARRRARVTAWHVTAAWHVGCARCSGRTSRMACTTSRCMPLRAGVTHTTHVASLPSMAEQVRSQHAGGTRLRQRCLTIEAPNFGVAIGGTSCRPAPSYIDDALSPCCDVCPWWCCGGWRRAGGVLLVARHAVWPVGRRDGGPWWRRSTKSGRCELT